MSFVWISARKDLMLRLRDPLALLMWMGIPLIVGGMIAMVAGGSGAKPTGVVLVADNDGGMLGSLLSGALGQGELGDMFIVQEVDEATGRARMHDGDAAALLVLPAGFTDAVLTSTPVELELMKNPSLTILPGIVEELVSAAADLLWYLQLLIGEPLKVIAAGPEAGASVLPSLFVSDFSVTINQLVDRMLRYLDPPVIDIATVVVEEDEESIDFMAAFLPGMIFMSLLFMAQGLSEGLWREHEQGTLRRTLSCPTKLHGFLLGMLLAAGLLFLCVGVVGISAGIWLTSIGGQGFMLALVWGTGFAIAFYLIVLLIQTYAKSARAGNVLTSFLLFPLLMIGGSFFPFEAMPSGMAAIGRMTPNGWALTHFRAALDGGASFASLALPMLLMLAGCGVLFFFTLRRLRTKFGH